MRKLLVFFTGMLLFLQHGQAQFPIARHFWLNPNSYNHTLSPTSNGGYILAAAREELGGAGLKNTIAVLKLDNAYNIQHPQTMGTDAQIIGLPGGSPSGFDAGVNFEVHDVTENTMVDDDGNVISFYVICGSIIKPGTQSMGMVAIVDQNLSVQSIREYPNAEVFYSVYADGNYFYVCGKTPITATAFMQGIVLRDNIFVMIPTAYTTSELWEYHKIIPNNNGRDIVVSGTFKTDYFIGFTAFDIASFGTPAAVLASRKFIMQLPIPPPNTIAPNPNSRVLVANDPNNQPRGFILSAMTPLWAGPNEIFTYFSTYTGLTNGYRMSGLPFSASQQVFLEDMTTSPRTAAFPQGRIAWVGHTMQPAANRGAFYIATDLSFAPLPNYIYFPSFVNPPRYSQLHKVHYNAGDFHCGGFYTHNNATNDKTTYVVAPEQTIIGTNSCGRQMPAGSLNHLPLPGLNILNVVPLIPVMWLSNTGHQVQYNFCDTDCDNVPLNLPSNSNCGN